MSNTTERLLQIAAVVALLYFGYTFAERTFIAMIQANQRAAIAEQRLAVCEAEKAKR